MAAPPEVVTPKRNLETLSALELAKLLDQLRTEALDQPPDQQLPQDQQCWEECIAEVGRRFRADPNDPDLLHLLDAELLRSVDSEFIPPLPAPMDTMAPSSPPDTAGWRDGVRKYVAELSDSAISQKLDTCDFFISVLRRTFPNPQRTRSWQKRAAMRERLRRYQELREFIVHEMLRRDPDRAVNKAQSFVQAAEHTASDVAST
jgi:hypothetical protein